MSSGDSNRAPLVVESVPVASVRLDPKNARTHPAKSLDAIGASLRRFGQQKPIVVDGDGVVVAGNGTLAAAVALGWHEIQVVRTSLRGAEARAFAIADNRTGDLSEFDEDLLAEALSAVQRDDATLLDAVGFSDRELSRMLNVPTGHAAGPGNVPLNPVTRPGDLWVLGDHRILCGDSTKADDVLRVMAGEKAALCATDPPYLVDYTGDRPNDSGKDWTDTYCEVDSKDADGFFRAVFTNVLAVLGPKAAIYCWHAHKRCGDIQRVWRDLGILDHQQIIWVKPTPVFCRVYWRFRHEPCMLGWRQGDKPEHDGNHEHDSVWEVDWDGKARVVGNEHPTEKPVELFARPMRKHTQPGNVVFEPFSGSGSQIIAAEQTGRRCRAVEITPAYVDVAVRRWEHETSGTALLNRDGSPSSRTFDAVSRERIGRAPVDASP